jgi:hypothetical protein
VCLGVDWPLRAATAPRRDRGAAWNGSFVTGQPSTVRGESSSSLSQGAARRRVGLDTWPEVVAAVEVPEAAEVAEPAAVEVELVVEAAVEQSRP